MSSLPPALVEALAPVLQDLGHLAAHLQIVPDDWAAANAPQSQGAMVWLSEGTGAGIYVLGGDPADRRIAMVADQVQEIVVESLPGWGLPAVWPECPDHPDSHPLEVAHQSTPAVWICPRTRRRIAEIGQLAQTL